VFHSYKYGGSYEVTLTVSDVAGLSARTSQVVTVIGPSASAAAEGGGGSSAATSSGTSGGASGGGTGATVLPAPTISELVLSKSLRNVLRRGLAVRYTVSEQVTGRFEVLISTAIARRLHLSGAPAAGLAAGSAPQTVIGKAILATAKGGAGTLTIQLRPSTVKRLRHMHGLTLVVRMLVHNAHAKSAAATATVSLSR
jgi:hypothetical protein